MVGRKPWLASLGRRVIAFSIDLLLLCIFGFFLSLAYEASFVQLGARGVLIGMVAALLYFGILNSRVSDGQTLGKKLTRIKVVDRNGKSIDLLRSFVRYCIFAIPLSLLGVDILSEQLMRYIHYPLTVIVIGSVVATVYLLLFNYITKQSLHDLVVRTLVVNSAAPCESVRPMWRAHLSVTVLIFMMATVMPRFIDLPMSQDHSIGLAETERLLREEHSVISAKVTQGESTLYRSVRPVDALKRVEVSAMLAENIISDTELARKLAMSTLKAYQKAKDSDEIVVRLNYGFAIGIWSRWSRKSYRFQTADLSANGLDTVQAGDQS
ncbi:RDD family protein [Sinobacterium caligoides]|uniref:RDD family protein n=1 Tax=Sinobacterium caligoides TaxID=933926 RepID=A0A3N2DFX4_9GAMM|nr:RDD family protein [Sinobacterium caligoides]ROR98693.1 RDD family protein [Sinobacterium caligoides]